MRIIFLLIVLLVTSSSMAQTTIFSATFETALPNWVLLGTGANQWNANTCAGNGTSAAGVNAAYVTNATLDVPCGANAFAYSNASSGIETALIYSSLPISCTGNNLNMSFDYRLGGNAQDTASLVYSINGGTTWVSLQLLTASASWSTFSTPLPVALNSVPFLIGFRFTYDAATISGAPLAIDNVLITSTDNSPPTILCPGTTITALSPSCAAIIGDLTKTYFDIFDNCTDSASIVVTQSPIQGTVLPFGVLTTTITLTAFDLSGNSSFCTYQLNFIDNNPPVITSCPANQTLFVNAACQAIMPDLTTGVVATDNCGAGGITYTQNPLPGTLLNGAGTITLLSLFATDATGRRDTCFVNITNSDTIAATLTCPVLPAFYANGVCLATITDLRSLVVVQDNCQPNLALTIMQSPASGSTIGNNQLITFTVSGGNLAGTRSCSVNIQVLDTVKPIIACPIQITQNANITCQAALPNYLSGLLWSDNCTSMVTQMTFIQSPAAGTLVFNNTLVTITATDFAGNSRSCVLTQLVVDVTAPSITCPLTQTVYVTPSCAVIAPNFAAITLVSDNCTVASSIIVSQVPSAGSILTGLGLESITLTATDLNGLFSSCSFNVNKLDTIKPIAVQCPPTTTAPNVLSCQFNVPDLGTLVVFSDNCSPVLTYVQSPVPGTLVMGASQLVYYVATDGSGNQRTCVVNVLATDIVPPIISVCATSQTVLANSSCNGILGDYRSLVTASDDCTPVLSLSYTQVPAPGSTISSTTNVAIFVADLQGNSSSCNFSVLIIDGIAPTPNCTDTVQVAINSSCQYTIPNLVLGLAPTDNCTATGLITSVQNPLLGAAASGITTVLITSTDGSGNTGTCTTVLQPIDLVPAIITCPLNITVNNGSSCSYLVPNYAVGATVLDNCSNYSIVQSPAVGTYISTGHQPITLTVIDAGGNNTSCVFTVFVVENVAPVLTSCPTDIQTCNPIVNYTLPTATDNCGGFTFTQSDFSGLTSGSTFPVGITGQEYSFIDSSGNLTKCIFSIEILPSPSPAVIALDTVKLCDINNYVLNANAITSGNGTWTFIQGSGTFNNQNAATTGVNNLLPGVTIVEWAVASASCGTLKDTLVIVYSIAPLPASVQDTVYVCNALVLAVSANPANVGVGQWSSSTGILFANATSPLTNASNFMPGWNTGIWTITNGGCPPSADTMHIFANKKAVILTNDTTFCSSVASFTIYGSIPEFQQSIFWSVNSGGGIIANPSSNPVLVTSLSFGENKIIYGFTHPVCATVRDTIVINYSSCESISEDIVTMFSPNNDGKNDFFAISGLNANYPECEVKIVNRWGGLVYESIGYASPWDGKFKDEVVPVGTYFYTIRFNDTANKMVEGSITIIK